MSGVKAFSLAVVLVLCFVLVCFQLDIVKLSEPNGRNYLQLSAEEKEYLDVDVAYLHFIENIRKNKNIFFIETKKERTYFPNVFLCNFESAAYHNKDFQVTVVLGYDSNLTDIPQYIQNIPNIKFMKVDFSSVINSTDLNKVIQLWASQKVENSFYHLPHVADLMRLVLIYRYGGLYMDQDTLSLSPMPEFSNFIGSEVQSVLINGVMKFESGHYLIKEALNDFASDYIPEDFSHQGPMLMTKLAEKHCENSSKPLVFRKCDNFNILESQRTCPLYAPNWRTLFEPIEDYEKHAQHLKKLQSFALHMWHNYMLTNTTPITIQREHLMYKYSLQHCPLTEEFEFRPNVGVGFYDYK